MMRVRGLVIPGVSMIARAVCFLLGHSWGQPWRLHPSMKSFEEEESTEPFAVECKRCGWNKMWTS
jgi:hypothetical protein